MTKEIWKDIEGYEGYYMISNQGRVKGVERYVAQGTSIRFVKERLMKLHVGESGYPSVSLCKDRKSRSFQIHRLLAKAFIPNPDNKGYVDHIDTDRFNYSLSNLRWVTAKENANNPLTKQHREQGTYIPEVSNRANNTKRHKNTMNAPKKVYQYILNGDFIAEYESAAEAERQTGILRSAIGRVCLGRTYSAGNYIWRFDRVNNATYDKPTHPNAKAVLQFDREHNLIKVWPSLKSVCDVYGSTPSNLSKRIARQKFRGKYIWKFKE